MKRLDDKLLLVDIHLLEPARDDAVLFMHSPMNFDARRALLEEGYTATTRTLREEDSPLRLALEKLGLTRKA